MSHAEKEREWRDAVDQFGDQIDALRQEVGALRAALHSQVIEVGCETCACARCMLAARSRLAAQRAREVAAVPAENVRLREVVVKAMALTDVRRT